MSSFPDYPPQRTFRVGLVVSLLFLLAVTGGVITRCRQLCSTIELPTHPARISPVQTGRSRLLGWSTTEYTCRVGPAEVRAWYATTLVAAGWRPAPAAGSAAGGRYRRESWLVEVRAAAVAEGTEVTVLATHWPGREASR